MLSKVTLSKFHISLVVYNQVINLKKMRQKYLGNLFVQEQKMWHIGQITKFFAAKTLPKHNICTKILMNAKGKKGYSIRGQLHFTLELINPLSKQFKLTMPESKSVCQCISHLKTNCLGFKAV